jgi:hypothetical protein
MDPGAGSLAPRMAEAGAYLNRQLGEDGRFVYRIHLEGVEQASRYNVLRHAGSLYALGAFYEVLPDPVTRHTIVTGARYLVKRHLRPIAAEEGVYAIFSLPGEEVTRIDQSVAKLGGTALGIVAFTTALRYDEGVLSSQQLRGLGRFVLFMQRPDGSFRSRFREDVGFGDDFESLYYPGEAVLALMRLHQWDGDPIWLDAAARATAAIVRRRQGLSQLPADHWLLIAAKELLAAYDSVDSPAMPADRIRRHLVDLARGMLREQARVAAGNPELRGSFAADGRCTPTATRLEGLLSLYGLLDPADPLRAPLRGGITQGMNFLLRCQVLEGPGRGGFVRAVAKLPDAPVRFNERQAEIRIDYVQHALSAMLAFQALVCDSGADPDSGGPPSRLPVYCARPRPGGSGGRRSCARCRVFCWPRASPASCLPLRRRPSCTSGTRSSPRTRSRTRASEMARPGASPPGTAW